MKKAIFIILLAALLSGCGNAADTNTETASPAQTTAVSHNTNISETALEIKAVNVKISEEEKKTTTTTTAETTSTSKTTTTTTKAETTTSGTTSKSTTRKAVSETTTIRQSIQQTETYIIYYDEPAPETQQTQPEVRVTEAKPKTTTTVQTSPPAQITTVKPIATTQTTTQTIIISEPQKMNVTEHWLIYFADGHNKDYYVNVGRGLPNDGSDYGKAEAVFEYMRNDFNGENNCIYMSSAAYCLCEGIGLDCGYALISNWYNHCANAVRVDGTWYVLDTQAGGFLCADIGYTKVVDEYENTLGVTLSDQDY